MSGIAGPSGRKPYVVNTIPHSGWNPNSGNWAHRCGRRSAAQVARPGVVTAPGRCGISSERLHKVCRQNRVCCNATIGAGEIVKDMDVQTVDRISRLEALLQLRKIYRNCIRSQYLLGQPGPLFPQLQKILEKERTSENGASETDSDEQDKEIKSTVLQIVADMQLTSEQLKASLRSLSPNLPSVFEDGSGEAAVSKIVEKASAYAEKLKKRVALEMPSLPFPSKYVSRAVADARDKRSVARAIDESVGDAPPGPIERLGKAEKAAEKFVASKFQQVKEIPPEDYLDTLQNTTVYLKDLWDRLNGGGQGKERSLLPDDLPRPLSTEEQSKTAMSHLSLELEKLEKKIQEASKNREAKLRKAGVQDRLKLAFQMKMMDDEVLQLTRLLAVRSLQLQMEYIYMYLEEEAMDISEDCKVPGHISRQGSTEELSLLAAEFSLLDEQLSTLAQTLVETTPSVLVRDNVLQNLVEEVDDLRRRLGISPEFIFGGSGLSWRKTQLQIKESVGKIEEGVNFLTRGVRLMGTDVGLASKLFSRAALGGTLKPREVAALRRTFRDLLTFVPFATILLIPLTPIGHVLVFGFIQRYFPEFFPSQFSSRRQNLMTRYDLLREELLTAQAQAEQAEEEAELARAAAAVARLTAPDTDTEMKELANASRGNVASYGEDSAMDKLQKLQEQVAAAALDAVTATEEEL